MKISKTRAMASAITTPFGCVRTNSTVCLAFSAVSAAARAAISDAFAVFSEERLAFMYSLLTYRFCCKRELFVISCVSFSSTRKLAASAFVSARTTALYGFSFWWYDTSRTVCKVPTPASTASAAVLSESFASRWNCVASTSIGVSAVIWTSFDGGFFSCPLIFVGSLAFVLSSFSAAFSALRIGFFNERFRRSSSVNSRRMLRFGIGVTREISAFLRGYHVMLKQSFNSLTVRTLHIFQ